MKILLTNDDGITASGIKALHEAVTDPTGRFGGPLGGHDSKVMTVAPLTAQSATSHGLTFHQPLMTTSKRIDEVFPRKGEHAMAVDGRPADCMKLAIAHLWPEVYGEGDRPDLVLSGINAGANVGINVIYSGTVAAALEAAFLGIPSIAVSLHIGDGQPDQDRAAAMARRAIEHVIAGGVGGDESELLGRHRCVNINLPVCDDSSQPPSPEEPELVVAPMNTHGLVDQYDRREAPGGQVYYWASGHGLDFQAADPGTDVASIFERKISITPIRYDLTKKSAMDGWRERLAKATVSKP
ncbi:MAG: 5'/3'-nucleotidase SurE [Phycisphaerales bacterium JB065]